MRESVVRRTISEINVGRASARYIGLQSHELLLALGIDVDRRSRSHLNTVSARFGVAIRREFPFPAFTHHSQGLQPLNLTLSGTGTNLKVGGGTGPERSAGKKFFFGRAPPLF